MSLHSRKLRSLVCRREGSHQDEGHVATPYDSRVLLVKSRDSSLTFVYPTHARLSSKKSCLLKGDSLRRRQPAKGSMHLCDPSRQHSRREQRRPQDASTSQVLSPASITRATRKARTLVPAALVFPHVQRQLRPWPVSPSSLPTPTLQSLHLPGGWGATHVRTWHVRPPPPPTPAHVPPEATPMTAFC